jgi:hypothetical protein
VPPFLACISQVRLFVDKAELPVSINHRKLAAFTFGEAVAYGLPPSAETGN